MGIIDSRYTINGLLKTENTALANLAQIADACGSWITYDTHEGKFAVVVNKAGTAQWHFDDSNIIGAINIAFTPLDKLYNTVKVNYPHEDLKGQTDWVQTSIPANQRSANEYENPLVRDYGVVTNPVQAALLGFIELKQSRVDKVVSFKTDYSKMGIKAGDLFDVTNSMYGWTAKMFRVISVSESDADDGSIIISITGLEYDSSVYDEDLTRYVRSDSSGIMPLASLPAPTKPIVTPVVGIQTPYVHIETSLIGGLVTSIELWSSSDVTLADNLRSYSLLKTIVSNGEPFALNTAIPTDVSSVNASTFVVKCRSINSEGCSVFSLPSDTANYSGITSVTDLTPLIDPATGNPLGGLGLVSLLKLLQSFMGNGNTSMTDKIGQMMGDPTNITNNLLPKGFMISASSGQFLNSSIPAAYSMIYETTFIAPYTGTYSGQIIVDQNSSGAAGGRGAAFSEPSDIVSVQCNVIDDQAGVNLALESSGGQGAFFWTDWSMSLKLSMVQGKSYTLQFYANVLTGSNPNAGASMTLNWNIFTVKS